MERNIEMDDQELNTENLPARKQSTAVRRVKDPVSEKKSSGKRPGVRGGRPVGRKHLKKGDLLRNVHVSGIADEVE